MEYHLSRFQVLAIVDKAAVNTHVQLCVWRLVSTPLGKYKGVWWLDPIARVCAVSEKVPHCLPNCPYHSAPHQQCVRIPCSPSSPAFVVPVFRVWGNAVGSSAFPWWWLCRVWDIFSYAICYPSVFFGAMSVSVIGLFFESHCFTFIVEL